MRIKSYSKINLSLRVINKLKNGMHNIETNSVLINLFDEIDININKQDIILEEYDPATWRVYGNRTFIYW